MRVVLQSKVDASFWEKNYSVFVNVFSPRFLRNGAILF